MYADHHGWLQGWLRRRLGDACTAADLAQDTFVRVLGRPLAEAAAVDVPRAWLATIARGLLVDHIRRETLARAYVQALADLPAADAPSPEDRALLIDALVRIGVMLDGLPVRARTAFLMSRLDGMSYPEIATSLGVSLSSVEKYMASAIRHCVAMRASLA